MLKSKEFKKLIQNIKERYGEIEELNGELIRLIINKNGIEEYSTSNDFQYFNSYHGELVDSFQNLILLSTEISNDLEDKEKMDIYDSISDNIDFKHTTAKKVWNMVEELYEREKED